MKLKNVCLFLMLSGLQISLICGQDIYLKPNIIPSSPNAGAIAKFGTYEVNTYTGVPDISIPIYEIQSGELTVPITLRYHASGIRVTDAASWVGLGWALDAGGQITRRAMGLDDEKSVNGYLRGHLRESLYDIDPTDYSDLNYLRFVRENIYDTEPDIFSFSIPGKSGKFFFDGQNDYEVVQIPYSPVKIDHTLVSDDLSFDVTDERGNTYLFGQPTREATNFADGKYSYTAFMLDTIISQNRRDTISFSYVNPNNVSLPPQYTYSVAVNDDIYEGSHYSENQGSYSSSSNPASLYEQRVTEIRYKGGKVVFVPSTGSRLDVLLSKSLDTLKVYNYNYLTDTYSLMKKVTFHYSQFANSNRLKLDSLSLLDKSNTLIERYRFEYNTTVNLPVYNSTAVDYWGYYNGHTSNTSTVPQTTIEFLFSTGSGNITISNGNSRESSNSDMQANVLKRIYYPTGGYTDFEYEANRYVYYGQTILAGGLRIKSIKSYDVSNPDPVVRTYEYNTARNNFILDNYFFVSEQYRRYIPDSPLDPPDGMRQRVFSSSPSNDIIPWDGAIVVYPKVTEYIGNGTANTGKIVYQFTDVNDGLNSTEMFSKPRFDSYFYKRGHLQSKTYYRKNDNGTYQPVTKEYNTYDVNSFQQEYISNVGFICDKELINDSPYDTDVPLDPIDYYTPNKAHDSYSYDYSFYSIQTDDYYPTSRTETQYDQYDSTKFLTTTTSYNYDNFAHQQVNRIVTTNSKGDTKIVYSRFPADYASGNSVIDTMKSRNMHAYPIEQYTKIGGNTVSGQLNLYRSGSMDAIVADQVKILEIGSPVSDFDSSYVSSGQLTGDSRYSTYVTFDTYDAYNNITKYTPSTSAPVSFVWGYKNFYPIAQIMNPTSTNYAYSSFETKTDKGGWTYSGNPQYSLAPKTGKGYYYLSSGSITRSINATGKYRLQYWAKAAVTVSGGTITAITTSSADPNGWIFYEKEINITSNPTTLTLSGSTYIDELRLFPVTSQMTTYTYEPNLGISSQTDENSVSNSYEYDDYGRLKFVKDQDGNIIQAYDYNYVTSE